MTTEPLPAIEPVTEDDVLEFSREFAKRCTLRAAIEQDRRRVAERQAAREAMLPRDTSAEQIGLMREEIERLRAEVAQADAVYNDAVTLAQMNLDRLKAVEAEVAALKAAFEVKP